LGADPLPQAARETRTRATASVFTFRVSSGGPVCCNRGRAVFSAGTLGTMKAVHIAVVGATGAVGREVLRILEERDVTLLGLRPIASARSEGKTVPFRGEDVPVTVISERAFDGVDLVIWDTPDEVAVEWMPKVRDRVVNIDNSSAFRLYEDVPLVVPEVNPESARAHKGLVANPNCTMMEERRVASETRKILGSDTEIFATTVRVPTVVGHGISAWVEFERPIEADEARALLKAADGVTLEDDPKTNRYPTTLQSSGI